MSERGQDLRAFEPLFEHLGRGFDEVGFHSDAADSCPLLLPAKNVVHQMAELVKESFRVAVFHQAGVRGSWLREIALQNCFRQLLAADSIKYWSHLRVAVLARTGMHIEIEAANGRAVFDHIPGFNLRVPNRGILFPAKADMEKNCGGIQDSLLHLLVGEVRADAL